MSSRVASVASTRGKAAPSLAVLPEDADLQCDDQELPVEKLRKGSLFGFSRIAAGHRGGTPISAYCSKSQSSLGLGADENLKAKFILKQMDEAELHIYQQLWRPGSNDPVHAQIAKFEGVVEDNQTGGLEKEMKYLRLTNLLRPFSEPKVMDVKLRIRTFLEDECSNPKQRPDLFEKMIKKHADQLTDEEKNAKAITKYRYMTIREKQSTSMSLGFRIDGAAGYVPNDSEVYREELSRISTREQIVAAFDWFLSQVLGQHAEMNERWSLANKVHQSLLRLRNTMEASPFVKEHECIGTSLLVAADSVGQADVFWIDFAKTRKLPADVTIDHRSTWILGNHEDGLLFGVDNMVEIWSELLEEQEVVNPDNSVNFFDCKGCSLL